MALLETTIINILTTKEDAYNSFCDVYGDLDDFQKENLHETFQKGFLQLYFDYISPKAKTDPDNYTGIYKKGKDDLPFKIERKRNEILRDKKVRQYNKDLSDESIAASIWLERRKRETTKIKSKLNQLKYEAAVNGKKFKSLEYKTIQSQLTEKQLKKLFIFLSKKENPYIINCDEKTFLDVFGCYSKTTTKKHEINWVKGIPLFHYFFYFLNECEILNIAEDKISAKLNNGQFFINAEDVNNIKKFKPLSEAFPKTKFKRMNEVSDFISLNRIFKSYDLDVIKDFKELGMKIKTFQKGIS